MYYRLMAQISGYHMIRRDRIEAEYVKEPIRFKILHDMADENFEFMDSVASLASP